MQHHQFHDDLNFLTHQLSTLKMEMDKAISTGKSFAEVKAIHLQIKTLSGLIGTLQEKNNNTNKAGLLN
jgi:hypothetical protein